ncbi:MAG: phosphate acyltransferase PlsX [Victivallales bacterium]|nr:phosphate acyltransferase PlsX [Victivallales bacterium]MCF7888891.1 phosphate acyltransferase PlsX [Victivallales bacterium]
MKIVVDAMGGDYAPKSVLEGVAEALENFKGFEIVLVGKTKSLAPLMRRHSLDKNPRVELVHAEETVKMDDSSTVSLRNKKNSSITVGADIVGKGEADAIVTIGHTGAAVAATKVKMRTLPGVERPAIAVIMPAKEGKVILLDAGANVDCKPINLAQFAIMGELYSKSILGISRPKVGLLSVGDEDVKGNELTKEAFKLIKDTPVNFVGNVEGTDIFERKADIVVCDGFVGNAILKSCEGLSKLAMHMIKKAFTKNPFRMTTALLAQKPLLELKQMGDSEEYGGAPLLGVNGICIIGHGSSSPKGVKNAIKVAYELVKKDLNGAIVRKLEESNITF